LFAVVFISPEWFELPHIAPFRTVFAFFLTLTKYSI